MILSVHFIVKRTLIGGFFFNDEAENPTNGLFYSYKYVCNHVEIIFTNLIQVITKWLQIKKIWSFLNTCLQSLRVFYVRREYPTMFFCTLEYKS